jgi:hypothetical protein
VGGTGGQAGEHRGIMAKLMDVQAAQDSRRSKLFAWRPSTAAQRGNEIGGAAQRSLAPEDGLGRSPEYVGFSRRRRGGVGGGQHRRGAHRTRGCDGWSLAPLLVLD